LLVALHTGECGLQCDPLTIVAPIRFGVLATEGELSDVTQTAFAGVWRKWSIARLRMSRE
jgi:hypothetical protein